MGPWWNVNRGPFNVIMGPWNVNRGPSNLNRGPWNVSMAPGMGLWDRGM